MDAAQAHTFFQLAAAQGLDVAQNTLGSIYLHDIGVAQDNSESLRFMTLAAQQGLSRACFINLASFYENGVGVAVDRAVAIVWYKRALAAGHSSSAADLQRLGA